MENTSILVSYSESDILEQELALRISTDYVDSEDNAAVEEVRNGIYADNDFWYSAWEDFLGTLKDCLCEFAPNGCQLLGANIPLERVKGRKHIGVMILSFNPDISPSIAVIDSNSTILVTREDDNCILINVTHPVTGGNYRIIKNGSVRSKI